MRENRGRREKSESERGDGVGVRKVEWMSGVIRARLEVAPHAVESADSFFS